VSILARFRIEQAGFELDVDLDLPGSGVSSLFGPSGCGKTSLLRAMAGLDRHPGAFLQVQGETWQDNNTFLPPHRRPLGYVFQEPSLFDHLDVRRNIAYGTRRIPAEERRVPTDRAIELLDVGHLLDRKPTTLSGGEKQRVAIARALAVSPELLLMDEPLAAVDVSRKQEILPYIESLHRELDIPVVHVSHLPDEVARFADYVVLLGKGGVLSNGSVQEAFSRLDLPPAHESGAAALVDARVVGFDENYRLTRLEFEGRQFLVAAGPLPRGQAVRLQVAAKDVSLTLQRQSGTSILNILETTVQEVSEEGDAKVLVRLAAGPTPLLASITRKSAHELQLEPGKSVYAQVKSVALLS
jgi:molybdate transport system ATP-binding protein